MTLFGSNDLVDGSASDRRTQFGGEDPEPQQLQSSTARQGVDELRVLSEPQEAHRPFTVSGIPRWKSIPAISEPERVLYRAFGFQQAVPSALQFGSASPATKQVVHRKSAWDVLVDRLGSVIAPSDWAEQHDHYAYGLPKKAG